MRSPYDEFRGLMLPIYTTALGGTFHGDALDQMKAIPDGSVNLVFTSPPFALRKKKEYGNKDAKDYVAWFLEFAWEFRRILRENGSLVIDIGGSWNPGKPTKSIYHFELMVALVREVGFHLAQETYWYNPARLPTPAEWVTIQRVRLKDAVNTVWWLSKSAHPKASNRKVLRPYSSSMNHLIKHGYNAGRRPSGHVISERFGRDNGGAIPPNLISASNTASNDRYLRGCKRMGRNPHPARIPAALPEFFIKFLTDEGDLVVDPFGGSNVTGLVAEDLGRRWLCFDTRRDYLEVSLCRFLDPEDIETVPGIYPRHIRPAALIYDISPSDRMESSRVFDTLRSSERNSSLVVSAI